MSTFEHNPEDRYVVLSGRTDFKAGDTFESHGRKWRAVTNPVGHVTEIAPGITIPDGMPNYPEYPLPDGAVAAIELKGEA